MHARTAARAERLLELLELELRYDDIESIGYGQLRRLQSLTQHSSELAAARLARLRTFATSRRRSPMSDLHQPDLPYQDMTAAEHAEALAAALDDLIDEVDPDCEEHPHQLATLQRYRMWRREAAGQTTLDFE